MTDATKQTMLADGKPGEMVEGVKLAVFIVLVAFLAFVAGGITTFMRVQPVADFVQRTSMVGIYLYKTIFENQEFDPFWYPEHLPAAADGAPIVRHDPDRAWQGLNLVVSNRAQGARLIGMDGEIVHEWSKLYTDIWDNPPQSPSIDADDPENWKDKIYWRRAHLFPNGDLLVVFETPHLTPYGLGLAKIDKDSNVVWKLDANVHHDTAIGSAGEIYALTQKINDKGYAGLPELTAPFIDDMVAVVSRDGAMQKEISIVKALLNSDFAPLLGLLNRNHLLGDVMHSNTVQYIDAGTAARFPFAEPGQLLISMREMNVIAVLDPREERIVWAMTGMWDSQHEPQMLDNGRILLYDNQGHRGAGGISRIVEFDPVTGRMEWSYAGTAEEPLISAVYGSQQRLDNGNTLIVESNNGRAIEVTHNGDIVWEYRSPLRKESESGRLVIIVPDVVRVDPNSLTFLN